MKKIISNLILFLFTTFSALAQTYSLNVTNGPLNLPESDMVTLEVTPVGFTFPDPIPQGSFHILIGTGQSGTQTVYRMSATQVFISVKMNCISSGQMGTIMYNNSNPTFISAMGSFINKVSSISLQWTNQTFHCYGVNNGTATVAVKSGGMVPYTFIYKNDTTSNIALNQTLKLQGAGENNTITVKDNAGCTISEKVPILGAITLTVQGSTTTPSDATCNGSGIRYINANIGGSLQYKWYTQDSTLIPEQNNSTLMNQCAGRYLVKATLPSSDFSPGCSTMSYIDIPFSVTTETMNSQTNNNNVYVSNETLCIPMTNTSMVISIYDINGIEHSNQTHYNTTPSSLGKISIADLNPGIYIYKITSSELSLSGRFVK